MAEELKSYDNSKENRENYDLIIQERNRDALDLFVSFCDYAGFDRPVSSIEATKDYISTPDYEWIEQQLKETVAMIGS